MFTYTAQARKSPLGKTIGTPFSLCLTEYKEPPFTLERGCFIWQRSYTRAHFRRNITLSRRILSARVQLYCDNRFELFVNGKKAYDSLDFFPIGKAALSRVLELCDYFTVGENRIAIRAYQSGTHERFLSALCGSLEFTFEDGEVLTVKTDESFFCVNVCGFWGGKEDEGWETSDTPRSMSVATVYPIHPKCMRRSFYVKRDFTVKSGLKRAVLRASALGLYEPYLNGKPICDERFLPGAMDGCREYRELDITSLVKEGKNTVGAMVANGWYNCTAFGILFEKRLGFIAELTLEYLSEDGKEYTEIISTDKNWLCALSPLYEDDLQLGERYDARMEIPSWCSPECDSRDFVGTEEFEEPKKPLIPQSYPSVRVTKELSAVNATDMGDGRILYDFGSNNAARGRLTVRGAKSGDVFLIRYAERLQDGEPHLGVYGDVYYISDTFKDGVAKGAQRNCDRYVCRGDEVEVYTPKFTYTGFRYAYIEYPEGFDVNNIEVKALVLHNDLKETGSIETSYTPLLHIWEMICRSFRSNTVGGPTDCPTREKNFWNGDIQAFCSTAMWYCDVNDFLSRWTHLGRKMERNVYGWEDEEYILPLKLYRFYGNKDILEVKYPDMLELIEKREDGFKQAGGYPKGSARYRDHLSLVNVSHDFFAACWHTYMYKAISEVASILGDGERSRELLSKFESLRKDFNEQYFLPDKGDYSEGCQSGIILPIMLGICEESNIPALIKTLVDYVKKAGGPTTGFLTTEYLLVTLSENGESELAHDVMTRDTFPSWLHLWKTGSTTITESWHGEAGPYDESMNHYAFGSVGRYFFESLGGLKSHSLDMRHFDISPEICEKIGDFGVGYITPYGKLSSKWEVKNGKGTLWLTLPAGVGATVLLPELSPVEVEPSDVTIERLFEFNI